MKIHNDILQGSEQWLSLRIGKLTGSQASKIVCKKELTQTALSLAYELVSQRLTGSFDESYVSSAMQWGKDTEPYARDWYTDETFENVKEVGFVELSDYVGCSPDGVIYDDNGNLSKIIEIKCPSPKKHLEILHTQTVPKDWYWQCQFNSFVCGGVDCDFICFDPRFDDQKGIIIPVPYDGVIEEYVDTFVKKLKEIEAEVCSH